jgi:diguanylate cyclase (GGDEF)-like protein
MVSVMNKNRGYGLHNKNHLISKMSVARQIGADYPAFLSELVSLNWFRMKYFGILAIIIFTLLLLVDWSNFSSGKWDISLGYPILFYSHLSIMILLTTATIVAWFKPIPKRKKTSLFHPLVIYMTLMMAMLHMVVISIGDVFINGSVAAYIGLIFSLAFIFVFPTWYCLLIYLSCIVFMLFLLHMASKILMVDLSIQTINVLAFSIFAAVLSRMIFYSHVRDFLNRKMINDQQKKLEDLSRRDHLTNAFNRRSFAEKAAIETERIKRYGGTCSMVIFDLDHFKNINDRYGHASGDRVLVKITEIVNERIRKTDTLFRWGGEEFIILSPETDLTEMARLAEKIRQSISGYVFEKKLKVTASFGVSEYNLGESIEATVHRADTALYKAKNNGRNRVEVTREDLQADPPQKLSTKASLT